MSTEQKFRLAEVKDLEPGVDTKLLPKKMEPVKTFNIYAATIAANIAAFTAGACLCWTSPVIPLLKGDDLSKSPLDHKITSSNEAWISSIIAFGALVAPFINGPLSDKIGRKWVLLSSSIYFIVALTLLLLVNKVWMIYVARVIQGFGCATVTTVMPMYVGEISTDDVRGSTGSIQHLFLVLGNLYVLAIGPYVSYYTLQWCIMGLPIVFIFVFFFMPESPYFYVSKGRNMDATKSLQFLRGQSSKSVQNELVIIQTTIEQSNAEKGSLMDLCRNVANRKSVIIVVGIIIFQQLSGHMAVLFNAQSIFESANTGFDAALSSIILGGVQVIASSVAPFFADRFGRKTILSFASILMTLALAALGAFFYIQATGGDITYIRWLPLSMLVLYIVIFCFSFGPLPTAMMGEMFASNIKSIASSLCVSTCWLIIFVLNFVYPYLNDAGAYYAFWLFSICCVGAFFFIQFVVLETKGLSFQEIQSRLRGEYHNI